MLSVKRYEMILALLEQNQVVKVSELSKELGVTEKTIRIDLEALEKNGLLKRIHGGAVLADKGTRIVPIEERQSGKAIIKEAIAQKAKAKIQPYQTVLLDGGSTTEALAHLMGDIPLTVITNDIKIAYTLLEKEKIQLMVLGGTRIGKSPSLIGAEATAMLQKIRVNHVFFGTTGISMEHGLTVLNHLHADWKKQIIQIADEVTLLTDATKFEKVGLIQFASLTEIDEIITDHSIEEKMVQLLKQQEIALTIVSV
ncbi:putative transcriptional regulator [Bacillus sp. TS-2]|nr:putative transcriptional regulator [Bacillus sp. TS-2]